MMLSENNSSTSLPLDTVASAQDIEFLYRLILGRRPESEAVVLEKVGHDFQEAARSFLESREFRDNICLPVSDGRGWSEHLFQGTIDSSLLNWVARRLLVQDIAGYELSDVQDWPSLLRKVFHRNGLLDAAFHERVDARAAFLAGLDDAAKLAIRPRVVRKLAREAGLFDLQWYEARYREAISGYDPERFYFEQGWRLGHSPSLMFDTPFYLDTYRDVADGDTEPLEHYMRWGALQGRRSLPPSRNSLDESLPVAGEKAIFALSSYSKGPISIEEVLADPLSRLAVELAPGRHMLEVGAASPQTLDRLIACRLAGAAGVRLIEDRHVPLADGRLRATGERLGEHASVEAWLKSEPVRFSKEKHSIWNEQTRSAWLLHTDLFDRDLRNKVGPTQLLVSPAPIDGCYEILRMLRRLEALTVDLVLMTARLVPSDANEGNEPALGDEEIRFAEELDADRIAILTSGSQGPSLATGPQLEHPSLRERRHEGKGDDTSTRWWFFGTGGLGRLLAMSGLELLRCAHLGDGQGMALVARKRLG